MQFYLEVELSSAGEIWKFYNEDREKVTEIEGPTDTSVGRLVRAAVELDQEAAPPLPDEAHPSTELSQQAWFVFRAPHL